jgi:hypothetical protein
LKSTKQIESAKWLSDIQANKHDCLQHSTAFADIVKQQWTF